MTDQALFLDQLTPLETLDLLSLAGEAPMLAESQLAAIRVEISRSAFGAAATLVLPLQNSGDAATWSAYLDRSLARFSQIRGAQPLRADYRDGGLALAQALAWLLLESGIDPRAQAEPCHPAQFLLITADLTIEQVASLFEDLRFHTTQTRIAAARHEFFFHILDDEARRSSFQSLIAGAGLHGSKPLAAFPQLGRLFFMPAEKAPDQRALARFAGILENFPGLYGGGPMPASGPFFAIASDQDPSHFDKAPQLHLYPLSQLAFHNQFVLQQDSPNRPNISLHQPVQDADRLARLREALHRAAPNVGYRLELRATPQRESAESERRRLLERQAEIAYKLAYLDSVSRPRPQLLRFSDDQLPAFAELIRAFPLEVLQQGFPRYTYTALVDGQNKARGFHWLYLEPEDAVLQELDPFQRWSQGADSPRRYWLDPFWSRHYHSERTHSLVFVPESTVLFPAMHAWSATDMDQYLRDTVSAWAGDRLSALPTQPLYVFGPDLDSSAELALAVLDLASFEPLRLRLAWINNHMALAQTVSVSELLTELASQSARSRLAQRLNERHSQIEAELEETLLEANRLTHRKLGELTETVNGEMNLLLERAHETLTFLANLHDDLEALTRLRKRAEATSAATHKAVTKADNRVQELTRYIQKLEAEIDRELQLADQARQRAAAKVRTTIVELDSSHRDLQRKLLEILRIKR